MIQIFSRCLSSVEYGVASVTAEGERESGDRHLVRSIPGGVLLAVVDGSGHGPDAAAAAQAAIGILESGPIEDLASLVHACHERLKSLRGAVMSVATIRRVANVLTWLGVGDIQGVLFRGGGAGPASETMLQRPGVVGYRLPPLQTVATPIQPGDLLIVSTDGIRANYGCDFSFEDQPQNIADRISAGFRTGHDDGLVLVARYLGEQE